jgi:hypothetical protein
MSCAIRPTVTQRVRGFLATQGVDVKPWAPLDDTYASLYRLMAAKRDDAEFWGPVQRLLGEIVEDAAGANGRLPAPQAELLKGWDIEDLVRDLRRALPSETAADGSAFKRFSAGLSAPVLGGFLLLGMAASGCDTSERGDDAVADAGGDAGTDIDGGADAGPDTDTSWAQGCDLAQDSVLWKAIYEAEYVSDDNKAALCACFAGLNESWDQGLTDLFENASSEVAAAYLELMITCCANGKTHGDFPSTLDADFCAYHEDTNSSDYKGVAFPADWGKGGRR